MMDKYEMSNYLEKNFKTILYDHIKNIEKRVQISRGDMDKIYDLVDEIKFYKSWQEDSDYNISVFLNKDDERVEF